MSSTEALSATPPTKKRKLQVAGDDEQVTTSATATHFVAADFYDRNHLACYCLLLKPLRSKCSALEPFFVEHLLSWPPFDAFVSPDRSHIRSYQCPT